MASNYGLNFGFLRSDEAVRVAEGRFRVPTGVAWQLGTAVEVDPATPGYLKVSAANSAPVTGYAGLLLQEMEMFRSIYDSAVGLMDTHMMGVAKPANLAIITNGAGTKVWFKNTPAENRLDGRVIAAKTMWATAGVTVGTNLGWDGTKWVALGGGVTSAYMKATFVDVAKNYVEAVLLA